MQDVCLSSPRVALEFYRAARDALLLYEVVIPVKVCAWNPVVETLPLQDLLSMMLLRQLKARV